MGCLLGYMGIDVNTDESTDGFNTPSTGRVSLFVTIIIVMIVSIAIVSLYLFAHQPVRPVEVVEEIEPWQYPLLGMDEQEALEAANAQLAAMELGSVEQIDPNSNGFRARLLRDNSMGIIYWKFENWDMEIKVNADTGEIIRYYNFLNDVGGPAIAEKDVEAYAIDVATQFSQLPEDMDSPWVWHSQYDYEDILLPNGTWGEVKNPRDWSLMFNRTYQGVTTSDHILVRIRLDGSLSSYSKDWTMDLESFDATYTVSEEEARQAARDYLNDEFDVENVTFQYCNKMIDRPKAMEGWLLPFDRPLLVWDIECEDQGDMGHTFWITVSGKGDAQVLSVMPCA